MESPAPVTKIGAKWNLTAAAASYRIDGEYIDAITSIRHREQTEMDAYVTHTGCLMEFLGRALDDPEARPCGKCAGCRGQPILKVDYDHDLVNRTAIFSEKELPTIGTAEAVADRRRLSRLRIFRSYRG